MDGRISGLNQYHFCSMRKSNLKASRFDGFDKVYYSTDGYDDYLLRYKKEGEDLIKKLLKVIEPDQNWKFLDVGCGMGGTILALKKRGFDAQGTEVSGFCLRNSPSKKWMKRGEATNISYEDNSFDVVICMDVLCYLNRKQIEKASKELIRVAKNYLYIETVCKGSPNSSQKENPDRLRKDNDLLTQGELKKIFEDNGVVFVESLYKTKDFNGVFIK